MWYGFKVKHPKAANIIHMVFFFVVFSEGVTIWQYIVMTFLPYAFGYNPDNYTAWGWAPFKIMDVDCTIFGDAKGLGYFIAYEIAVFTAQCINFPLQRNITYRSHGNVWYQAMWYFIGWVIISVVMNVIWGVCNCLFIAWGMPDAVITLIKTVITGGVSMVIFFFIFMVIFPNADKTEKKKADRAARARALYESDPTDANRAACERAGYEALKATEVRKVFHAEGDIKQARSLAEAKISAYLAGRKNLEKGRITEDEAAALRRAAVDAVTARDRIVAEQTAVLEEIARAGSGRNK